jgi:hypothetical protein
MMMYYLNKLGRIQMKDFTLEMKEILGIETHEGRPLYSGKIYSED